MDVGHKEKVQRTHLRRARQQRQAQIFLLGVQRRTANFILVLGDGGGSRNVFALSFRIVGTKEQLRESMYLKLDRHHGSQQEARSSY